YEVTDKPNFMNREISMEDSEIRTLLQEYNQIILKLKEAGVLKSDKLVADYGEYLCAKMLNLTRMESSVNKDYDAVDKDGKKYQIKTRKYSAENKATVFPV